MKFNNKLLILKNKHCISIDDFHFKCSIGKFGLTSNKREGDKKTPKGIYGLGDLFYRSDRVLKPKTKLNCLKINSKMGWCDDPNDKENYNKLININRSKKERSSTEKIVNIIILYQFCTIPQKEHHIKEVQYLFI